MREYKQIDVSDIREWFIANSSCPVDSDVTVTQEPMPFSEGLGRMFRGLRDRLDPYFIPDSAGVLKGHDNTDLFLCIEVNRTQQNGEWCVEMMKRVLWACGISICGSGFDLKAVPDGRPTWTWYHPTRWRGVAGSECDGKGWDNIFNSNLLRYIWVCEITRRLDVAGYDMGDKNGPTEHGANQAGG